MALPESLLPMYEYLLLFAWVLVGQLGIPLPAAPILLAAGAFSAQHELNFAFTLLAGLVGSLTADIAWFLVGRKYGQQVLRLLCKLSFEPAVCVRRTREAFVRHRAITLLIAKFVPGLGTLASPIAAQSGLGFGFFFLFDSLGSALWLGSLLAVGRFFGDLLRRDPRLLDWAGRFSGVLLALGILGFIVWRVIRRQMILKQLFAGRLEPEKLKRQLDAGEKMFIVDLRHPLELLPDPYTLPGAVHFSPETLAARSDEIPRDRDIVLYCTCPSEATAARTAMTLHKLGIERVRPLRGGYGEWKRLGFPVEPFRQPLFTRPVKP
ncbi:MAG TPA: rhodanese-like domain-containing protein [Terracidiphilus sp.]|nr:rhodanese-like domain-containing protein [Terracidiphilus sp.]